MFESSDNWVNLALGLDAQKLNIWQMGLRAIIIYIAALVMVRIGGDRRFIGKFAAIDVVLGIILGSTLSRAINGSSAFFSSIGAGFVLVAMHWLFASLAYYFPSLDKYIKGRSRVIIRDGQICQKAIRQSHITQQDLQSILRLKAKSDRIEQVEIARLESDGQVSLNTKSGEPKIVEFDVEPGVQKVRIEIDG
ncbi:DUF421 domain-containing protein [Myxosarcina sp. GI1]|uniref:DUF421 domain-containing protein n=1 Tax=Myxosarcina sp. GI1 TaxID=1541065 RepID=UPI000567D5BC|nr:YetF domain-containing protein [Myxosarcina sp. GI1]